MNKIEEAVKKLRFAAAAATDAGNGTRASRATERGETREGKALLPTTSQVVDIDAAYLRTLRYLSSESDERLLADQYRLIKRPLLKIALNQAAESVVDANFLLVTSALANEGKTFTCLNLSLSLAQEQDVYVLLVDADVQSPRLSGIFGLAETRGLLDFLADDSVPLESIIYRTSVPSLFFMPAGQPRSNSTELLSGPRMADFVMRTVRRSHRAIVVADSAPVSLTSETHALASWAGQIMLVVRAGTTPRELVVQAVDVLGNDKALNLVLNCSAERVQEAYGAYADPLRAPSPSNPSGAAS